MPIASILDRSSRPWRGLAGVGILVVALTLITLFSAPVAAAGLRAQVRFDPRDLEVRESLAGAEISMRGLPQAGGEEAPALPMSVHTFYVPEGLEVRQVRAVPREEVLVAEGVHLARREKSLEPDPDRVSRRFPVAARDESGARHPGQPSASLGSGFFGGYRLHSVALFPARWEGSDLIFTRSFDLELELGPAADSSPLVRLRSSVEADRAFREALAALVENPTDLPLSVGPSPRASRAQGAFAPAGLPSVEGSAVDMVIITTAALESGFQPLADWKTKKGVPAVIRTVEWIDSNYPAGHDRAERIRLFIQDAYSKWGTFLVLIGGDYDDVTPRSAFSRFFFEDGTFIPTDQYWTCLEGDWNRDGDDLYGEGVFLPEEAGDDADLFPDVFIGRAPVSDLAEVATFVAKSFTYDKNPPAGYVEDHCVLAEVLFPQEWEFGDPMEDIDLDAKDFTEEMDALVDSSWTRVKRYQSENNEDRAIALSELSTGHHLMTVMNHGDAFKFSVGNGISPLIFVADTDTLTNGDRLTVMLATACNPNQFDLESCGESFLNNPNGGGIAVIGPTRVDFVNSATDYHKEMLRIAFSHGVTRLGAMTQVNRVPFAALSSSDGNPDRWTALTKNLLGDPEIRFWTEEPQAFLVSHTSSVPLGTTSLTVTVTDTTAIPVADALVCVSDAAGTYARERTNALGQAVLQLTSAQTSVASVVVTKAEFKPHETTVLIGPVPTAHLALTDHVLDDDTGGASSGNGDGVLDAGETIELDITALNGGGASANTAAVNASIEAGSSATFDLAFDGFPDVTKVFIGPNRTSPGAIPFTLDFANPAIQYIGSPNLVYARDGSGDQGFFLWQDREGWHLWWSGGSDSVEVTGTISTDGRIRATRDLDLELPLDSFVLSAAQDTLTLAATTHTTDLFDQLDFTLADDTMLTITSANDSFGNIGAGATGSATVVFAAATAARDQQLGYVDLVFTSNSGGPWTAQVPLVFEAPSLEAYVFTVDDSNNPPVSGDGDGVIEVGETVRLTPTVLNRGGGAAAGVLGFATSASGITFVDNLDSYGAIESFGQTSGTDGYVFTVDDGTGTTIDLTLVDGVGRSWAKSIDFLAPSAPTGLTFTSTSSDIALTWNAADTTSDVAGYNVYRSVTSGTGHARQNFELLRSGSRYVDEDHAIGDTFYYQVTAVDSSGNESAPSSEIFAWTILAQVAGWPQNAGNNVIGSIGVSDADNSGRQELYVGSKDFNFYAWDYNGAPRDGFPIAGLFEIWSTPAIADIDEDGDEEIFWGASDSRLYAVHHDGSPVYGSDPVFIDLAGIGALIRSAVTVADVDFDSDLEFFFGTDLGRLYAFNHDGTGLADSTGLLFIATPEGSNSRIWGPIGVADLDGDDVREIVFSSWSDSVYAITPEGNVKPGFPRGASGGVTDDDYRGGVVIGDLDDDGTMEVVAANNNGTVYAYNHDGSDYLPGGVFAALPGGMRSVPALCNLDGDPELELLVGTLSPDGNLYAFNHDGTSFLPGMGGLFYDFNDATGISASPIVVDVDGDADFEILIGHRNGNFYAFHHDGTLMVGLPIPTSNVIFATAAAGDMDSDGDVDVAFGSFDQTVNVIDFSGASTPAAYEWPTYGGSNYRASVYGEPIPYQTGVGAAPSSLVFSLRQNSPNPFSGGTAIEYFVPRERRISLRIYNVAGRLVRTLVRDEAVAGPGAVVWDGRDDGGHNLSSGVYFYRLEDGDQALTRKSLLLRH